MFKRSRGEGSAGDVSPADPAAADVPLLELRHIQKYFGGTHAVDDVSLVVRRGTVHALVGENGAGKSTLGRIIAGVDTADSGEILVNGALTHYRSPAGAIQQGIVMIEQELAVAPDLSVAENVLLGAYPTVAGITSRRALNRRFEEVRADAGFDLPRDALVGSLRLAKQQEVTLLWALAREARLIVMDEPTAALAGPEAEKLRALVRRLSAAGVAVIFISHFLDEVLETAQTITIMRNGRHVETAPASETTVDQLIVGMLGRELSATFPPRPVVAPEAPVILRVENLYQPGVLRGISFEAKAGEIVGLFGLVGSGRSELAHAIAGATSNVTGTIEVNGVRPGRSVRETMSAGVMLLPESRKDQGLFIELSQLANTSSTSLVRYARWRWSGARQERAACRQVLETVRVEPLLLDAAVGSLSGGNQQKVLFAKCLINEPTVLVLDEPTRGVDIGAKSSIYDLIIGLAERGRAIIVISSELDEVTQLCHRVLIMREGRLVAEYEDGVKLHEQILSAAFGYEAEHDVGQYELRPPV